MGYLLLHLWLFTTLKANRESEKAVGSRKYTHEKHKQVYEAILQNPTEERIRTRRVMSANGS